MSNLKYLKCVFEKGFATVTERGNKKESWFPYIDLYDSNGDFFDSCNYAIQESSKLFAALTKISIFNMLDGVELIYSETGGDFVVRIDNRLYFMPPPRDFLRDHGVHEYHCEDKDIQNYLEAVSIEELLKVDYRAIINPENARELIDKLKTLA
jgi:hypothetical protein